MKGRAAQESAQTTHQTSRVVARLHGFFLDVPNPRILRLLIISSAASFSLGLAMTVEWYFHGRHHRQFHWVFCYALVIITIPVSVWTLCLFFALLFYKPPFPHFHPQRKPPKQGQHTETTKETLEDERAESTHEQVEGCSPSPSQPEDPRIIETKRGDCDALILAVNEQAHRDRDDTDTQPDGTENDIAESAVSTTTSRKETVIAQGKDPAEDSTTGYSGGASSTAPVSDESKEGEVKEAMQSEVVRDDSLNLDDDDEWIVKESF